MVDGRELLRELARVQQEHSELGLVQFRSVVTAHQYRYLYAIVERYVGANAKVLDWGCGNGHMTYALSRFGCKTTAYTLQGRPPIAALLTECEFVVEDGSHGGTLPFATGRFDAVVSVGVLEHVREGGVTEVEALREIRRVLKPDGTFACYHLPNRWSYIEAIAAHVPGAYHHQHRFSSSDIRDLCAEAGLKIVELRRYGALPRNFWSAVSASLANREAVAAAWDFLDEVLELVLSPVLQNYFFVARP